MGGCCAVERKETMGKKLEHDPAFAGPIRWTKRVPTDIICIVLFCLFWVGMVVVGFYGLVEGRPNRLLHPVDSKGRLCGVDSEVVDKPFLFFFDLTACANIYRTVVQNFSIDTSNLFSCPTPQVCVAECPNATEVGITNRPICVDGVDTTQFSNIDLSNGIPNINIVPEAANLLGEIVNGRCAPYYVLSTPIADRCIPTFVSVTTATGTFLNFSSNVADYQLDSTISIQDVQDGTLAIALIVNFRQLLIDIYRDLAIVWPYLLGGLFLAALVPFLYIFLMRWLAPIVVIFGIITTYLVLAGITGFSFYQFWRFETNANSTNVVSNVFDAAFLQLLPWWRYQRETWLAVGIIFLVVLLVLTLLLLFLIPRIILAIKIIIQASKAVSSLWSSLFYPFLTWFLLGVVAIYYVLIAVFLATATEKQFSIVTNDTIPVAARTFTNAAGQTFTYENGSLCDSNEFIALHGNTNTSDTILVTFFDATNNKNVSATISCAFLQFFTSKLLIFAQFYHLFGLFWTANYIVALGECALAGGFAVWYWAPVVKGKRRVPWFPVQKSSLIAFFFHSGSLAFGALIIAIIQLIRAILAYAQRQLKKHKELKVIQYILCALGCLFCILEKVLRYINRMAYIEIAIYGYGFCRGAYHAVTLLVRNVVRAAVKDRVAHFILFLGKLACVGIVTIISYLFFGEYNSLGSALWGRPLNYYLVPIIIIVFATYLISSGFLNTYGMAIDTLFICVLEDMERNDGSAGKENRFDSKLKNAYIGDKKEEKEGEVHESPTAKKKD